MRTYTWVILAFWLFISAMLGFFVGQWSAEEGHSEPLEPKVDTLVIRDTISVSKPIYVTRKVVDTMLVAVTDTMMVHDTTYVYLTREQVEWRDSLCAVFASGIYPQVDSVIHFTTERVIVKEIPVIQKERSRWGLGINAGYGFGASGLTPYVGVGVSYNLLSW